MGVSPTVVGVGPGWVLRNIGPRGVLHGLNVGLSWLPEASGTLYTPLQRRMGSWPGRGMRRGRAGVGDRGGQLGE